MNRGDLSELHYITPIANIASIMQRGILSNRRVAKLQHQSVAKQEVQDLRAKVKVPGWRALHEYANLYICARNPMLYKRHAVHKSLCVLRIKPSVLDLPEVVITDQNAASDYRRFLPSPGWAVADRRRHGVCRVLDAPRRSDRRVAPQVCEVRRGSGARFGGPHLHFRCICLKC